MRNTHLTVFVALMAWSTIAGAQKVDLQQACRDAEQAFAEKRPIPNDTGSWRGSVEWAKGTLLSCGVDGARVVAQALRAESRNTNPDSLREFMYLVNNFRDATIFQTLMSMAADTGSTSASRVWSLIALHRLFSPNRDIRYEMVMRPALADGSLPCLGDYEFVAGGGNPRGRGDPLPADAAAQWHTLVNQLVRDRNTATVVRNAAICTEI